MNEPLTKAQDCLFARFAGPDDPQGAPVIFILASPRTGSTLMYQVLVECFETVYFSNFVANYFHETPAVGVALDLTLNPGASVGFSSEYGKTKGDFGPSEASLVFRNWFGGAHPSQTRSAEILHGMKNHMAQSLLAITRMAQKPLVAKNAWNCFRIKALCEALPSARFIWLRRDIGQAAISDLNARYHWGGPTIWNSATTADCERIKILPYWEQVVEQQHSYNSSMQRDFETHAQGRYLEIWYEDLCTRTYDALDRVEGFFRWPGFPLRRKSGAAPGLSIQREKCASHEDTEAILNYVERNPERFSSFRHAEFARRIASARPEAY